MLRSRVATLIALSWLASMGVAYGNWMASGSFRYIDREFDQNGFTGVEPALPIRYANVEVRDPNAKGGGALLATGATDADGNFSILVSDNKTRTVSVRALTTSTATADGTPGADDDTIARPDADNWDVDKNYVKTAVNKSLEDFWDGWFTRGKGFKSDMIAAFQRTNVEFYTDPGESNDSVAAALPVSSNGTSHRTFFADADNNGVGEADDDFFSFSAVFWTTYTIETLNLWGKSNTSLQLLATDGVTILASNDNRAAGDVSSLITYTAADNGVLYIKSFHAADLGVYGSYDLRLSSAP